MFAFLLIPGIQQKLQVIFDDTLDITQVTFPESTFSGYPDRLEPKLRLISIFGHVDMGRLMRQICLVEKELVAMDAKDNRHRVSEGKR
jgi:hypothetical protein